MSLEERTQQKLRFARVHLDELVSRSQSGRGDDFERSHHEAFLAQLFGAYDALLNELNVLLGCGLPDEGVSLGKMRGALKARGISSDLLAELYRLEQDSNGWFKQAKDFRDVSMHVAGIPLSFYAGGPEDGKVALKHPRTLAEQPLDVAKTFSLWLAAMDELVMRLRREASTTAAV